MWLLQTAGRERSMLVQFLGKMSIYKHPFWQRGFLLSIGSPFYLLDYHTKIVFWLNKEVHLMLRTKFKNCWLFHRLCIIVHNLIKKDAKHK